MRHITDDERRARFAVRHAIAPEHRVADPEAATRAMTVLHATEPPTVYLSVACRVDGLAVADVDTALFEDRTLVRQLAMRRTLFVFPRDLLPAAWGSAAARRTGCPAGGCPGSRSRGCPAAGRRPCDGWAAPPGPGPEIRGTAAGSTSSLTFRRGSRRPREGGCGRRLSEPCPPSWHKKHGTRNPRWCMLSACVTSPTGSVATASRAGTHWPPTTGSATPNRPSAR